MGYAVITENDISAWSDKTGELYHFPKRYLGILKPGTKVIYYKGRIQEKAFENRRLSNDPHYFGIGEIGKLNLDKGSYKEDYFGEVINYRKFSKAVPFRIENNYLEVVPQYRAGNYWRDGVRAIDEATFLKIQKLGEINEEGTAVYNDENIDSPALDSEFYEGGQKKRYTTVYERDPQARQQAVTIHGYSCMACGFNFEKAYGEWGKGFIHVHHVKPISSLSDRMKIDPRNDLIVLCANCHSMVHRRKDNVLSLEKLRHLLRIENKVKR